MVKKELKNQALDMINSRNESKLKMDSLLAKLRKGMFELSVQEDNFIQQMWNMYSTFKDLKAGSEKDEAHDKANKSNQEIDFSNDLKSKVEINKDQVGQTLKLKNSSFDFYQKSESWKPIHKNGISKSRKVKPAFFNRCGYQSDSCSLSSLTNPLLDTISSLTSNNSYSDSDDYEFSKNIYYQRYRRKCRKMFSKYSSRCSPNQLVSSSDAESNSYAGSNSIDSGYKSLCPTPEVPDSTSKLKFLEMIEKSASETRKNGFNQQKIAKSLIKECEQNKVIKNNQKDFTSFQSLVGCRSNLYNTKLCIAKKINSKETQLEHLFNLRKSIVNALQQCKPYDSSATNTRVTSSVISSRSSSPASTVISKTINSNIINKTSISPSTIKAKNHTKCSVNHALSSNCQLINTFCPSSVKNDSNCTIFSPCSSQIPSKSVRFNQDVKVAPFTSIASYSLNQSNNKIYNDSNLFISDQTASFNTKSILKDSLCTTLRSQIESGQFCSDYSLEDQIDTILYGPRKTNVCYNLKIDHLDIPYVAMIEKKYRNCELTNTKSKNELANSKVNFKKEANLTFQHPTSKGSTSYFPTNAEINKYSKSELNENIKNVFKMLDDVQNKFPKEENFSKALTNFHSKRKSKFKPFQNETLDDCFEMKNLAKNVNELSYSSLPENHIYEEVMYDCMDDILINSKINQNENLSLLKPIKLIEPMEQRRENNLNLIKTSKITTINVPLVKNSLEYRIDVNGQLH